MSSITDSSIDISINQFDRDIYVFSDLSKIPITIKSCIYYIENLITQKGYVGQTRVELRRRAKGHLRELKCHKYNSKIYASMKKYGIENFIITILEVCDESILDEKEIYWISKLKTLYPNGYNLTTGGQKQKKYTKELKKNLSDSAKRKDKSIFKKHSDFIKQSYIDNPNKRQFMANVAKITHTGRKQSKEWIEKRSSAHRGFKFSDEQKLRLARNHMKGKIIICIETGEEFLSAYEASLATGANIKKIGSICNGKRKSSNGFSFRYK